MWHRRIFALGLLLVILALSQGAPHAQYNSFPPGTFNNRAALSGSGGCVNGTNAAAFAARASGSINASAYCTLINALDTHSLFAKLDGLYIFATDSSADAILNLVSSSYTATLNGSPAFSANNGFTGVDASTSVYIDTGFAPSTAAGQFAQNSAHGSAWSFTNAASGAGGGIIFGAGPLGGATSETRIFPKYNDGNAYADITNANGSMSAANADSRGFYVVNRSGSTAAQLYRNATSIATTTSASQALTSSNITILAANNSSVSFGGGYQISVASWGSSLSSGDVTNFYNDICTFLTTVHGSC